MKFNLLVMFIISTCLVAPNVFASGELLGGTYLPAIAKDNSDCANRSRIEVTANSSMVSIVEFVEYGVDGVAKFQVLKFPIGDGSSPDQSRPPEAGGGTIEGGTWHGQYTTNGMSAVFSYIANDNLNDSYIQTLMLSGDSLEVKTPLFNTDGIGPMSVQDCFFIRENGQGGNDRP